MLSIKDEVADLRDEIYYANADNHKGMKQILLLLICILAFNVYSQEVSNLGLTNKKEELRHRIIKIEETILSLEREKNDYLEVIKKINIKLLEMGLYDSGSTFLYARFLEVPLKDAPRIESTEIGKIPVGDSAMFIENIGTSYVKVKYIDRIGFIVNGTMSDTKKVDTDNQSVENEPFMSTLQSNIDSLRLLHSSPECKSVSARNDKFTGQLSYHTPEISGISVHRYEGKGSVDSYFISIHVGGQTPVAFEKGVYILFEDGEKFHFPNAEIDSEVADSGDLYNYIYTSFVLLEKSQVKKLMDSMITDVRLYVFDRSISESKGEAIRFYVSCLGNK